MPLRKASATSMQKGTHSGHRVQLFVFTEEPGFESQGNISAHGPWLLEELCGHSHSQWRLIHCSCDVGGGSRCSLTILSINKMTTKEYFGFFSIQKHVLLTNVNEKQNGAKSVMKYISSSHLSVFISVPVRDNTLSKSGFVVPDSSSILSLLVVPPQPPAMCCCQLRLLCRGSECPVLNPSTFLAKLLVIRSLN